MRIKRQFEKKDDQERQYKVLLAKRGATFPRNAPARRSSMMRMQDIDDHIGARIRERRIRLGLTQRQLGELIGVTYQQAQKYERGINRISAGRLYDISKVLNVSVTYFYEGIGEPERRPVSRHPEIEHVEYLKELARRVFAADELANQEEEGSLQEWAGKFEIAAHDLLAVAEETLSNVRAAREDTDALLGRVEGLISTWSHG